MGKVAKYENDKRRKDFLAAFENNFAAAAEHLFGLVLSPSKRRFFHSICQLDKGLAVDNQLGSIADSVAIQAAVLCLLLKPDAVVNIAVREGEGVAEGVFVMILSQLVKRIVRKEPWLIEFLRLSERGDSLTIGGKRSIAGRLNVIFYNGNTVGKLVGFNKAHWFLPRADTVEDRAVAIMSAGYVVAFYGDRKQIGHVSITQDDQPADLVSLTYERTAFF